MAHNLQKFYRKLASLDVRTNPLVDDPTSAREGSKNFRQNYKDRLQRREGFQHKTAEGEACEAGLIEYKYRDINTGESLTQVLGVSFNGNLYRQKTHRLKLTRLNTSSVVYYSLFYDDQAATFKIVFYSVASAVLGSVNISLSQTLDQLKTAINALALTGLSADVVNESGTPVVSSVLAYLLDVVYMEEFEQTATDIEYNPANYWEQVTTPDGNPPFVNAQTYQNDADYEGITYVNANNACYITDGGFPFKYDGYSVYRAGMPKTYQANTTNGLGNSNFTGHSATANIAGGSQTTLISQASPAVFSPVSVSGYYIGMPFQLTTGGTLPNPLATATTYYVSSIVGSTFTASTTLANAINGVKINTTTAGSGTHTIVSQSETFDAGAHYARFQLVYKDPFGSIIYGKVQPTTPVDIKSPYIPFGPITVGALSAAAESFFIPRIVNDTQFPIYACQLTAGAVLTNASGSVVLQVESPHNVAVGQALRVDQIQYTDAGQGMGYVAFSVYMEVTAISATTITISVPSSLSQTMYLANGLVLNACYVPSILFGKEEYDAVPYGPSWQLYMQPTAVSSEDAIANPYYIIDRFAVPRLSTEEYSRTLGFTDTQITAKEAYNDTADGGEDLPRACKYLNKWQEQIVQAGRPVDPSVANDSYPTVYDRNAYATALANTVDAYYFLAYSEAHLCDFQSIYWADPLIPEGFPQSGLNEESFDSIFNDKITGTYPNKDALFVFKERTTAFLTGTLSTGDLVKEFLEADVGCATQNAIQEVRGSVVFMDQNMGFWSVVAGRLPEYIGLPLEPFFKENFMASRVSFLNFKKAKSANFRAQDQYICYIPAGKKESGESAVMPDPTADSIMFVFDYASTDRIARASWYPWQNINAAGGVLATANDELLISQRATSNNRLWKQKFTGSIYDFSDHTSAINFVVKQAFLTMGEPSVDKSWARVWINSVVGGFSLVVSQYANFIDTSVGDLTLTFPSGTSKKTVKDYVKANIEKLSGLSWGFSNNVIHQDVQIDGWEVEASGSFDKGEPKQ